MKKLSVIFLFLLISFSSCTEVEELSGECIVYLKEFDDSGTQLSYVIDQDVRRNKKTGVFTYRVMLEDGKSRLWSISRDPEPDEEGNYRYFSKSQSGEKVEVDYIQCANDVYLAD
ncbi:hypothetical protein ACFOUP_05180 [Belliella kenyensis]|uniref:Lipoprotein n=1 Tax=Belliella kenyensis TaxID=1472724 RepID=A0ABV8EL66_9BACT|nr:hypothetical protein [Belliella kenyensis]MCH7402687.1 hypothetical protein [Belliella kenyensis]MDN3603765.1 hypothetical protein [Belliella kenyensis]